MSKKREISAVDVIYDLSDKIDALSKKIDIIDSNVKLLNNKISKLNKRSSEKSNMFNNNVIVDSGATGDVAATSGSGLVIGNINTYGYIVDSDKKPLVGVLVNIFDSSNNVIKNAKTDKNGYWTTRLPPGSYGVEYNMNGFSPINRKITLNDDIKKYEVR